MTIKSIFEKFGILTLEEAEKTTKINAETLRTRIHRKTLKGFKIGKTWLILLKDIIK